MRKEEFTIDTREGGSGTTFTVDTTAMSDELLEEFIERLHDIRAARTVQKILELAKGLD